MVLRGLQLVITGRPTQIERAAAVVELVRPIWQDGQSVSPVDLQSALGALNTGRGDDHAAMGEQVLAKSQKGNLLRPRTLRPHILRPHPTPLSGSQDEAVDEAEDDTRDPPMTSMWRSRPRRPAI